MRPDPEPPKSVIPHVQVRDDFLTAFQPAQSETNRSAVDSLFGSESLTGHRAVDSLFSINDIFDPDTLKQTDVNAVTPEKTKSALGKSKTWWLSGTSNKKNLPNLNLR